MKAIVWGLLLSVMAAGALAGSDSPDAKPLESLQDYKSLTASEIAALADDAAKQERLAELLLASGARVKKSDRAEGIHALLRAAVSGRHKSMLQLAEALDRGAFGFKELPAAAACWAATPSDFEKRFICFSQTDVRDPRTRVPCDSFHALRNTLPAGKWNGVTMARLCLANKTPVLLVPGPPPGMETIERLRLYREQGIELRITGDVYEEAFERYRNDFNRTTVAGMDAERGQGYMQKLSDDIEKRIPKRRRGSK